MWYTFNQNNSGGGFNGPEYVIIEADSSNQANERAAAFGIYFDGIDAGLDCECCGDRWHPVDERDADPKPSIYGKEPSEPDGWFTSRYLICPLVGEPISGTRPAGS